MVRVEPLGPNNYWFTSGWPVFVVSNELRIGTRLFFEYEGNSCFDVVAVNHGPDENGDVDFTVWV